MIKDFFEAYKEISYVKVFNTKENKYIEYSAFERCLNDNEVKDIKSLITSKNLQLCRIQGVLK